MRKLACFALAFSAAIFLAQYALPDAALLPLALVLLCLSALTLLFPYGLWRRRVFLCFVAASLALGWDWLYLTRVVRPAEAYAGVQTQLSMTLCAQPEATSYGAKATVRADGISGKLVYYGDETLLPLHAGARIEGTVYLNSARRVRDEDVTTFSSRGIFLLAYRRGDVTVDRTGEGSVRYLPQRAAEALRERIRALTDGDVSALLVGILTGKRGELSAQAQVDLTECGIYHILAVSGMHCAYLLLFVTLLVGRHRARLRSLIAAPTLLFYVLLTGASPSTVRAAVMLLFLLAAPLAHRQNDPLTALSFALMLLLVQNPFAAASVSLQLSFAAVTGLIFLTPRIYRLLVTKKSGRVWRAIAANLAVSAGCIALTAPISAYWFGYFAPVGVLSNLLCLWAAGALFLTGLAAVLLSFLSFPLGRFLAFFATLAARYLLTVAHALAGLPHHAAYTENPYLRYWIAFCYLLFALPLLFRERRRRAYALAALLAAVTFGATVSAGEKLYTARLDAVAVDVGQGASTILKSGEVFAVVDCGSANTWRDAGCDTADRLLTMGGRTLDYLILTHFDSDHVNGAEHLFARVAVLRVLIPRGAEDTPQKAEILALAARYGAQVEEIGARTELPFSAASLTVFPPLGERGSNERGLSVLATAGENDLLITGDMDKSTEKRLLAAFDLPDIEVLAAGHHGSADSTGEPLLTALDPETVLISVGENAYGHPSQRTLRRLAPRSVYRTDVHGSIRVIFP